LSALPKPAPAPLRMEDTPVDQTLEEPGPVLPLNQHPRQNASFEKKTPVKPTIPPLRQVAEKPVTYADEKSAPSVGATKDGWNDIPPPPDNFPDNWESEWQPSFENAEIAARPESKSEPKPVVSEPRLAPESIETEIKPNGPKDIPAAREAIVIQQIESVPIPSTDFLPSLYIPLAQEEKDKEHPPQQITVMLRSTGDKERDKRRIKTIFGTLVTFHGKDRFSFQIFENCKGHLIDFPNDTTRVCLEVLDRLKKLMGEESWRVEEITFQ